jgi:hypothetical protein
MAIFEIQAGGKTFEVEAPDQATALAAIQAPDSPPPPGYGGASVDTSDPLPKWDIPGDIGREFSAGVQSMKEGLEPKYTTIPGAQQARVIGGAIQSALSPLTGTLNATAGSALSYLPTMDKAKAEEGLGLAMMALRPGKPTAKVPTAAELKKAGGAGFDEARRSGVEIKSDAIKRTATEIRGELEGENFGINAELAPKTFSILERLQSPPEGSVATISDYRTMRRALGNAARDFNNPTEQLAASAAMRRLDDFLGGIGEADVAAGDAGAAAKTLREANANYAAGKRAELLDDKRYAADIRSSAANSGQNLSNTARQRVADVLLRPKERAGYSPEELAQMERVVRGTIPGNLARRGGNLLGGGGGLGQLGSGTVGGWAGAYFGDAAGAVIGGAALPAAGHGLKALERASTARQLSILEEMIRSRSPLMQQRQGAIASAPYSPRALGGYGLLGSMGATSGDRRGLLDLR